jgi:hypothetical protein
MSAMAFFLKKLKKHTHWQGLGDRDYDQFLLQWKKLEIAKEQGGVKGLKFIYLFIYF